MHPKFAKMAALGALGVAGGTLVLFGALIYVFSPLAAGDVPGRGGIDHVSWYAVIVAMAVPAAILAGAHVAVGRQLRKGPAAMH